MNKIVVIEGGEHCGKTWLARRIQARKGLRYAHLKQHADYTAAQEAALSLAETPPGVVIDRHLLSDQVYGPALRDGPFDDAAQTRMWGRLLESDFKLIVALPKHRLSAQVRWAKSMERQTVKVRHDDRVRITTMWYALTYGLAGWFTPGTLGASIVDRGGLVTIKKVVIADPYVMTEAYADMFIDNVVRD